MTMKYKGGLEPRWKEYDDEGFLRWTAEYPVSRISAAGPVERADGAPICEFHQQLPDGSWRSALVPYHWIQFGGIATLEFRACGLVGVDPRHLKAMQARDARKANLANPINRLVECPCCGRLYYTPRIEDEGASRTNP